MTTDNGQYLTTKNEVLNNSEFTEADLTDVYGEGLEFSLKLASRKTYNIMYSAYRGVNKGRQRLALNYMIAQDTTKQDTIRDATIEYIRGALSSGMDLKEYLVEKPNYSKSVIDILKQNDLWIVAEIQYQDEDIE